MIEEYVVLLDEQDKFFGILEKYVVYMFNMFLYLVFFCWLFNEDGQLLVI